MANKHATPPNWRKRNRRRCELIHKKYQGGGLTSDEERELESLQAWMGEWMRRHFPRDTSVLDEMKAWLEAIKRRIGIKP